MISGRLVGSDQILPVFEKLYGITTWRGVMGYIKRNGFPIHRTGQTQGKPLVFIRDVVEYELRNGRNVTINEITYR
jgi:hypothetical protein